MKFIWKRNSFLEHSFSERSSVFYFPLYITHFIVIHRKSRNFSTSSSFHSLYFQWKAFPMICSTRRLDYCGISVLIVASFIPWLYYAFYCEFGTKVAYLLITVTLGSGCIVVSLWDKFSTPKYRTHRARNFFINIFSRIMMKHSFDHFHCSSIIHCFWSIRFYTNMSLYFTIWFPPCFHK